MELGLFGFVDPDHLCHDVVRSFRVSDHERLNERFSVVRGRAEIYGRHGDVWRAETGERAKLAKSKVVDLEIYAARVEGK